MKIAQISDFHFTKITWNPFRLLSKRFWGNLNWVLNRQNHFSEDSVFQIPKILQSVQVDWVLLGGDFTTTALPKEYERAKEFVHKLPSPWIAIPGNHDHYTYRSYRQKHFYNHFTNLKSIEHKADFFNLKEHQVEAHRLKDQWWLVALDTARATPASSSRGFFSMKQEEHLRELLSLLPLNSKILLFNHYPFFQNDIQKHTLERGETLQEILQKDLRIKAYLHGHTHRHTIADLQPSGLPVILDGGCVADKEKGSWNVLEIEDQKLKVHVYSLNNGWKCTRTEEILWNR